MKRRDFLLDAEHGFMYNTCQTIGIAIHGKQARGDYGQPNSNPRRAARGPGAAVTASGRWRSRLWIRTWRSIPPHGAKQTQFRGFWPENGGQVKKQSKFSRDFSATLRFGRNDRGGPSPAASNKPNCPGARMVGTAHATRSLGKRLRQTKPILAEEASALIMD